MFKTGQGIGASLSKGLLENDWGSLGNNIANILSTSVQESIMASTGGGLGGGILSGLAGGLIGSLGSAIGGLFGGGKKSSPAGTMDDPNYTIMVNTQDIATAVLASGIGTLQRGSAAGLTSLQNDRMAQAAVGLAV